MKITANISGMKLELISRGYVKNEFYTEEEFKEGLLIQLKHEWKSYWRVVQMLQDLWNEASFNSVRNENATEKKAAIFESENLVRDSFKLKLMEYLMEVAPEWMKDVSSVDFNQSSGVLDVWKYDKDGKRIDDKSYTIENW